MQDLLAALLAAAAFGVTLELLALFRRFLDKDAS